ncbi:OmpH family outer membrane protein [Nannocystis sp. ILAH1]|uniref:OmpH family outer membrane protein n=1 Tax=Nannocystis sp. ILAH1 TaxID=2996789 RepID=UPI002270A65B|nr:OmpH family outer membrane protein [Nannocystis sp. ILAH1]MCY0990180.1 OmpH family outer membrane protein [Nannocystis sp. ILAH1]
MFTPQRRFTRLLSAAAVALAFVGGAGLAPGAVTPAQATIPQIRGVAVVDMQKVLGDTKQGQAARKKLEDSSKAKQEKLEQKRKKLEADTGKLKSLQGDKLAAAEEALQKEYMEMQQIYMTMQQELTQQESRVLEDIYKNCQTIIDKLAAEKNVDLVLIRDDSTVLFVEPGLDITAELVKRYNAKYPS